jgi:hypothetical protein
MSSARANPRLELGFCPNHAIPHLPQGRLGQSNRSHPHCKQAALDPATPVPAAREQSAPLPLHRGQKGAVRYLHKYLYLQIQLPGINIDNYYADMILRLPKQRTQTSRY